MKTTAGIVLLLSLVLLTAAAMLAIGIAVFIVITKHIKK